MDNPQLENGYTKIANEIMDALCAIRIPGTERQILDVIMRKTYGWGKKKDMISISQFQGLTGLKKPHVVRALGGLLSKKIIHIIKNDNKMAHEYEFNKKYKQWEPLPKKIVLPKKIMGVTKKDNRLLPLLGTTKETSTKETITKEKLLYVEIIKYLNEKLGTKYKPSTKSTIGHINARCSEGYKLDDFKIVIDKKTAEWMNDPKYSKFLRPETLFGTKFEGYLNTPTVETRPYSKITERNIKTLNDWEPPEERLQNG